jgi:hypothetical protein
MTFFIIAQNYILFSFKKPREGIFSKKPPAAMIKASAFLDEFEILGLVLAKRDPDDIGPVGCF